MLSKLNRLGRSNAILRRISVLMLQGRKIRIRIAKDTTYLTGPLTPAGWPDYRAALFAHLTNGVTPENNAMALLRCALGNAEIPEAQRSEYFAQLGVEPPPDDGDYFVDFIPYSAKIRGLHLTEETFAQDVSSSAVPEQPGPSNDNEQALHELQRAYDCVCELPWRADEFPAVAAWLAAQQQPMRIAAAASRYSRIFWPSYLASDEMMFGTVAMATFTLFRNLARAFRIRALLHLKSDRLYEAWDDVLTIHRIARLQSQGPYFVDKLVAASMEGVAINSIATIVNHRVLDEPTAVRFLRDLDASQALQDFRIMCYGERLSGLEQLRTFATDRKTFDRCIEPEDAYSQSFPWTRFAQSVPGLLDWNTALRTFNAALDRIEAIYTLPTHRDRIDAADHLFPQRSTLQRVLEMLAAPLRFCSPRATLSRICGIELAELLSPFMRPALQADTRSHASYALARLTLALHAYRAKYGEFPAQLHALSPEYLHSVPDDPFTNQPMQYLRTADGYRLYSVGPNYRDDHGRDAWDDYDHVTGNRCDDVAMHYPQPIEVAKVSCGFEQDEEN